MINNVEQVEQPVSPGLMASREECPRRIRKLRKLYNTQKNTVNICTNSNRNINLM